MSDMTIPEGWIKTPFFDTVKRFQSRGGKLKTAEYHDTGILPVVDQGKSLIVAYSDDEVRAFQGPYPVIIFGDHTRNVKLVDFKFAVGADGVVLLRPKNENELDISLLYYWLKYIPLHKLGYSRHFKLLNEEYICYPVDHDEQIRIVTKIEQLDQRTEEIRKVSEEREQKLDILLQSAYSNMIESVEWKPLKTVASLVRRGVKTIPNKEYEEMGTRSFGKGTFKKPVLTGKQIGKKRIYWIHEDDLVFNNVFAWERAIAVAKKEDHGRVGSHRFITYVPHEKKATSEFLCQHFLSEHGIEDIRAASPGSAGRNRTLGLKKLEKISVPVPDYDEQLRFSELKLRRDLIRKEMAATEEDLKIFVSALLAKSFRGEL